MSNDDNYDRIYDSFGLAALLARRPLQATSTSTTDNSLVRWDGISAEYLQDSSVTVDDNDNLAIPTGSTITFLGTGSVIFTEWGGSNTITLKGPTSITSTYILSLPAITGVAGDVLNIASISGGTIQLGWGTGYNLFSGPSSTTDNAIVRFGGQSGNVFDDSSVTISDGNVMAIPSGANLVFNSTGALTFTDPNQSIALFGPQIAPSSSVVYLPNTTGTVGYGLSIESTAATGTVWSVIGAGPSGPVGAVPNEIWTMNTQYRNIIGGTGVSPDIVHGSARNNLFCGIDSLDSFWYGNDNVIWGPKIARYAEGGNKTVIFGVEAGISTDNLGTRNIGLGTPYTRGYGYWESYDLPSTQSMLGSERNISIGNYNLGVLTTGKRNIAVGGHCLPNLTTGNDNVALGAACAGKNLVGGASDNIYLQLGYQGSRDDCTGVNNISFIRGVRPGNGASNNITIHSDSTAFNHYGSHCIVISGYQPGTNLATGHIRNVLIGNAGNSNSNIYPLGNDHVGIGDNNCCNRFGGRSATNSSVDPSVTIGRTAGYRLTENWGNVIIGDQAMSTIDYNDSGYTTMATGGKRNVVLGRYAMRTADNGSNITGVAWVNDNVSVGAYSLELLTTGNQNTSVGWRSDDTTTAGTGNICFGPRVNAWASQALNRIAFGIPATGTNANGGAYFGHRTYSYGAANAANWSGDELYESTSSKRFKTDIVPYDETRKSLFENLEIVWYKAKPGYCKDLNDDTEYIGLIAEELKAHYPEYVIYEDYKTKSIPKGINYSNMTTLLTKKTQECRKDKENIRLRLESIKEKLECVKKNFVEAR